MAGAWTQSDLESRRASDGAGRGGRSIRRSAALLLLAVSLVLLRSSVAAAVPGEPPDPDPDPDPEYEAPANGFNWSMAPRFGPKLANGIVDYHWNEAAPAPQRWGNGQGGYEQHEPAHVRPS